MAQLEMLAEEMTFLRLKQGEPLIAADEQVCPMSRAVP